MKPHLVVFSTLFPHAGAPNAGPFIRERMFRVGEVLPLTVVSPQPWFPGQSLLRRWKPHFRPPALRHESQHGIEVLHPLFFSVPGAFKQLDGLFMALGSYFTLKKLRRAGKLDILDAHFAYPDGYAATLLGKWLDVPVTITLRGTEVPHSRNAKLRPLLVRALTRAARVFSVSDSLRRHAIDLGIAGDKIRVVGNGVDNDKFHPVARSEARTQLGIAADAPVLISVGGLVERKGFHRVLACLPELKLRFPGLVYLIVGGAGAEGDMRAELEQQVAALGLQDTVRFLGIIPAASLKWPLSAADVFVLSTRNEGWANVFLEAMACGLPVISTDVGGNAEVVCRDELGMIVPFGDHAALRTALMAALAKDWDRSAILAYARDNDWQKRVVVLVEELNTIHALALSTRASAQ
ncbi:glycosyltransferase [Sulfuriferula multivorans]|uniref:glycosyltransferase n=1 Tax=Sulfuriferula multivorans TaxID=1559896 RepID=UPI001677D54B|nr:glycosyltransferase [Sulfuriferula multivorans]